MLQSRGSALPETDARPHQAHSDSMTTDTGSGLWCCLRPSGLPGTSALDVSLGPGHDAPTGWIPVGFAQLGTGSELTLPQIRGQHKAMSHTWLSSTSKRCPVPDPPQTSKAESSKNLSLIVSKLITC